MATNDIVLSAASRANLLSLQNTQKSIDATQLRLATGKKVNSALDNPQSFFTSQSLSNRASDLSRLLDGIGQSISSIQEADKGVSAITDLVTQAQSIVNSARDELAASSGSARLVGTVNLSGYSDIGTQLTSSGIATGDQIKITTVGDNGAQISNTVTISGGDTAYTLAAKITNAFENNNAGEITATITDKGYLAIQSKDGRSFRIGDVATGTAITTAGYKALGLTGFEDETRGTGAALSGQTVVAGSTIKTQSLYESAGNLADAGDIVSSATGYTDASGKALIANLSVGDTLNFVVNNSGTITSGNITLNATTTFQDVVDQINATASINKYVKAGFDSLTGQLTLTSLTDSVKDVKINFGSTNAAPASAPKSFNLGWGDSTGLLDPISPAAVAQYQTDVSFNSNTSKLDQYTKDYNSIRDQIDSLVEDANYRGINLLKGDNLTTFFNEDNSSKLVTTGVNFTANGLGLTVANFTSSSSIETAATITKNALDTVRSFGSSLANNLAVIQTRQTFTQETIDTLKAGSAALTNADLNEEGANLLALQTAQQLGVTSLSLASQSQQSVLRLF